MQRKQERHSVTRRDFLLTSATVGAGVLAFPSLGNPLLAGAAEAGITTGTYTNPVTEGTVDTFPDPVTIRGKDGYWYAYGTTNPIFQSQGAEGENYLPILRSEDLVSWEYVGDVFEGPSDFPPWFGASARLWAPDIRYINGKYYLYYSVDGGGGGIGLVTAPTPTGPWADSGGSVIRQDPPTGNIDQSEFTDIDGTKYLYWGSYDVMVVAQLNEAGTRTIGAATQVARARRGEAAFVVRRGDYYYLMYSEAGCCDGRFSGYQVKVGRSKNPRGPFVDRKGTPLTAATTKESFMLSANGNHWIGPGHNAVQTDLAGQDWFIYHAIPEQNPMLDPVEGLDKRLSTRPMLIDRLDWIDGWPIVRAGEWASETPQQAPVTQWVVGSNFNGEDALKGWRRHGAAPEGWSIRREDDAAGYVHQETPAAKKSYLVSSDWAPASIRVEADLRQPARFGGASGLVLAYRDENNHVTVWLDIRQHALITDILVNGESAGRRETPLPKNFAFDVWHNVAAEIRDRELHVAVSSDRLYDPLALHKLTLPAIAARSGAVGVASVRTRTDATNVGAAALYTPVDDGVPPPRVGALDPAYGDEFDGNGDPAANDPAWSWTRGRAPDAAVTGGSLVWPTQQGDINLTDNTASVLVRDSPQGDYTVETKVELDPTEPAHQAGLVFYDRDDRYVKLARAALQFSAVSGGEMIDYTDFAKEGARPPVGAEVFYASMYVGTPSATTCLRVQHRQDGENGQHEFRAATSQDGEDWVWGGVWKLPAEADPQIGLVSMGGTGATARFHYVRTYRP